MATNQLQQDQATARLIEIATAAHQAAERELAELRGTVQKQAALLAQHEEARKLIPEVIEELLRHERTVDTQPVREKLACLLADPVETLKLLKQAADPGNTVRKARLGTPVPDPEKQAAAGAGRAPKVDKAMEEYNRRFYGNPNGAAIQR